MSKPHRRHKPLPATLDSMVDTTGFEHMYGFLRKPPQPRGQSPVAAEPGVPNVDTGTRQRLAPDSGLTHAGSTLRALRDRDLNPESNDIALNVEALNIRAITARALKVDEKAHKVHPFPGLVPPEAAPAPPVLPPEDPTNPADLTFRATSDIALKVTPGEPVVTQEVLDLGFSIPVAPLPGSRQYSLNPIRSIQDGLTSNEIAFISHLWQNGQPGDEAGNYKVLAIGDRRLSKLLRTSYMTVRNLSNALQDKLAIMVRANSAGPHAPKVFVVFSYAEILRRWRKAGFVYGMNRNGGRALCDETGTIRAPKVIALKVSGRALTHRAPMLSDTAPTVIAPNETSRATTVRAHINKDSDNKPAAPAEIPPEFAQIITGYLHYHLGACDANYTNRLTESIRTVAPDATPDEVYCFLTTNLPSIIRNRNLQSKTGILLSRAPAVFSGESLRQLRYDLLKWREERLAYIRRHPSECAEFEHRWADKVQWELTESNPTEDSQPWEGN